MSRRHQLKPTERLWGSDPGPFEGNDVRVRGGLRRRCILCGTLRKLRLSHVIPKWAFRWHKEAWGGVVKTRLLSRGVVTVQQDANKHYLLCGDCEQRASDAEAYARAIVDRHRKRLRAKGTIYLFWDRYWHLRLDLIAQFISITALRIHYSESVPVNTTKIPLDIRKRLRRTSFVGVNLQGSAISAWRFVPPKSDPDHDPRHDIFEMYEDGELGRTFIMLAGGIEWAIFFDSARLECSIGEIVFRGRGLERIACLPYTEYRLFKYPEKWVPRIQEKMNCGQGGFGQPATTPESKSASNDNPEPDSELRPK